MQNRSPIRKAKSSVVIDSKSAAPWIKAVGSFIMNFGVIELATYLWLDELVPTDDDFRRSVKLPFTERVDVIVGLVNQEPLPKKDRRKIVGPWKRTKRLSQKRNTISHNPVILGWKGEEDGPPDFMGIPKMHDLGRKFTLSKITIEELNRLVDDCKDVAEELTDRYHLLQSKKATPGDS